MNFTAKAQSSQSPEEDQQQEDKFSAICIVTGAAFMAEDDALLLPLDLSGTLRSLRLCGEFSYG
jgi:hypothetical protein